MAKLNSFSIMVAVFLAHRVALLSPGLVSSSAIRKLVSKGPGNSHADFPHVEPIGEQDFPSEPLPDDPTADFLENCALRLTGDCGKSIFTSIFANSSELVSDDCCHLLVAIGPRCHQGLVHNIILKIPAYNTNQTITLPRSEKIWNNCVLIAQTTSPAPSPSQD